MVYLWVDSLALLRAENSVDAMASLLADDWVAQSVYSLAVLRVALMAGLMAVELVLTTVVTSVE